MDREAIAAIFNGATEVKLEGRVIPVVTARASGISTMATLEARVHAWAEATKADSIPLVEALAELSARTPEKIAEHVLAAVPTAAFPAIADRVPVTP